MNKLFPLLTLMGLALIQPAWSALAVPPPSNLTAGAYILMDSRTGTVLAEHHADRSFEPASLTKIMTTYLVFRALDQGLIQEDEPVTISRQARAAIGSRMFVEVNSQVPVIDLLYGIIVQSGNDASIALAEHIAGNEATFVEMMNTEGERLGLTNSHFTDVSGLGGPEHHMSARDIARVSVALINEHPERYTLFKERYYTWNNIKQPNRNRLLWHDETVDGIKTGYTQAAQYCLAASAERSDLEGMRLVVVVLDAKSSRTRVREAKALLNWGFRFHRTRRLHAAQIPLTEAPVWFSGDRQVSMGVAEDLYLTVPASAWEKLETTFHIEEPLEAPLAAGQALGTLSVRHQNRILHQAEMVALADIPESGLFSRLWDWLLLFLK